MPDLGWYAQQIKSEFGNELDAKLRAGQLLIQAKQEHPGEFVSWCRREFDFMSQGSVQNLMALARLAQLRPDLIEEKLRLSVMYQLGKTEEHVVQLVDMALQQGMDVTTDLLAHIRQTSGYLREVYAEKQGRVSVMLETAAALDDAPPEVMEACERHEVKIPAGVEFLSRKLLAQQAGRSHSFDEIMGNGGHIGGIGWDVHLSNAIESDYIRYDKDRAQIHKDENARPFQTYRRDMRINDTHLEIDLPEEIMRAMTGQVVRVIFRYRAGSDEVFDDDKRC